MTLLDSFKELPDDFKISVGDKGEMTLGQLRGLEGQLTERDTQIGNLTTERDTFRSKFDETSASLTKLLGSADKMTEQPDPADRVMDGLRELLAKPDPSQALFEDKLFGGALKTVEERSYGRTKKELDALTGQMNELAGLVRDGMTRLTQAQVGESYRRWYDVNRGDMPKGTDGKRMSLQNIVDYATQNNIVTGPGSQLLDLDRTLDIITAPTRQAAALEEAEQRGYQKGVETQREAAGRVLPLFGDRSAGGVSRGEYNTAGKSARQIMQERIGAGLQDLAANES